MLKFDIVKNSMDGKNYEKAITNAVDDFLIEAGVYVEGEVVKNIKRSGIIDTGRLRGSITYQTAEQGSQTKYPAKGRDKISRPSMLFGLLSKKSVVDIGSGVKYAAYNEYGTFRMRARPYMRPALRRSKTPLTKRLKELIAKGLKRGK